MKSKSNRNGLFEKLLKKSLRKKDQAKTWKVGAGLKFRNTKRRRFQGPEVAAKDRTLRS